MEDFIKSQVNSLLSEYRLSEEGWVYKPSNDKRRLGTCNYDTKTITISLALASIVSRECISDAIVHEIAHAIAGCEAGHGELWRKVVVALGGTPEATSVIEGVLEIDPWRGKCRCGKEYSMAAAPRRVRACSACSDSFEIDKIIEWAKDGKPMSPREIGGRYFKEYKQVEKFYNFKKGQ